MRKITLSSLVVPLMFIFSVGLIYLFTNDQQDSNQQFNQHDYRFNKINTAQLQQQQKQPNVLTINSIASGEAIKDHLRHDPSIILIKHKDKKESHLQKKHVTVKFKRLPPEKEMDKILKEIDGIVDNQLDTTIMFHSNTRSTTELLDYFNSMKNVEYVEPIYFYMQNQALTPNDYLYTEHYQWNLPVIQAEIGWDVSRGDENVTVAVVDTGVDLNHPDLKGRLVRGYNVIENNHYPDDDNGHGTHVAGIIASETNNRVGVAGVTWHTKIMPIKAMESGGYGTSFDIAKGIVWAVRNGAKVINLSLGNYESSKLMREAVKFAHNQNVIVVAASGNDNTSRFSYPAAYPEVIGVSAINFTGERAPFSNYGSYIDVTAPGVQIPSTYFNQQYAALSGTSMASPHVAGLAGLILSVNPSLKNTEVIKIIKSTAYDLGTPGKDIDFGHGLIDVANALEAATAT